MGKSKKVKSEDAQLSLKDTSVPEVTAANNSSSEEEGRTENHATNVTEDSPLLLAVNYDEASQTDLDKLIEYRTKLIPGVGLCVFLVGSGALIGFGGAPFYINGTENFLKAINKLGQKIADQIPRPFAESFPQGEAVSSIVGNGGINTYAAVSSGLEIKSMIHDARAPAEIKMLQTKSSIPYLVIKWGGGILLITATSAILYGIANYLSGQESGKTVSGSLLFDSLLVSLSSGFLNFLSVNTFEDAIKKAKVHFINLREDLSCGHYLPATSVPRKLTEAIDGIPNSALVEQLKNQGDTDSKTMAIVRALPQKTRKKPLERAYDATIGLIEIPVGTVGAIVVVYSNIGLSCDSTLIVRDWLIELASKYSALSPLSSGTINTSLSWLGGSVILAGGQNLLCILGGFTIAPALIEFAAASVINIGKLIANAYYKLSGSEEHYALTLLSKQSALNILSLGMATMILIRSGGTSTYLTMKCEQIEPIKSHFPDFPSNQNLIEIYHLTNIFNIFWFQRSAMFFGNFVYQNFVPSGKVAAVAEATKKAVSNASPATLISTFSSVFSSCKNKVAGILSTTVNKAEELMETAQEAYRNAATEHRKSPGCW